MTMNQSPSTAIETNWAGNHTYLGSIRQPRTIDEAASIVRESRSVRGIGSRHSFTDIGDATELIDLSGIDRPPAFDADARTITVSGAATYADVARSLIAHGAALRNLASLPHISVAGAISTATHGSGSAHGNLATSVAGLEFIASSGEIITVDRRTPDFDGMVVSLGALGLITAVTLDVDFDYEISQHVYDDLPLDLAVEQLGMILNAAYSVSVFTTYAGSLSGQVGQVWLKRRTDGSDQSMAPGSAFLDAPAAVMQHHPVPGHDPASCTRQLGEPGLWSDRLPHFRMGFTPSSGNEVQSEFFVDAIDGPTAFDALRRVSVEFADRLMVGEVRAVAADEMWLSPQFRRASVGFHFTWFAGDNDSAVRTVQQALEPFAPRPHWGKFFHADQFDPGLAYEMFDDFVELATRLDPHGVFRNSWWQRVIGG
jgi:xylitol oxidase